VNYRPNAPKPNSRELNCYEALSRHDFKGNQNFVSEQKDKVAAQALEQLFH
jgi:hypothetical protein